MKLTSTRGSLFALLALSGIALFAPSCGGDDDDDGGDDDAGNGGSTAGMAGKAGSGGTAGDTAGSAGKGGAGTGGTTAGTGGTDGGAGAGGEGTGGDGEGGQTAGQGGGGEGGGGGPLPDTAFFNFETSAQGWTSGTGVTVATSTEQVFAGTQSLKITHPEINNGNISFQIAQDVVQSSGVPLWPGAEVTFNVWLPATVQASTNGLYMQAFFQGNNYSDPYGFFTGNQTARTIVPGGWTTWTFTMPNAFPGGAQVLGIQLGEGAPDVTGMPPTVIAAGDIYLDSVSVTGGAPTCMGTAAGSGAHGFEVPLPAPPAESPYQVDNGVTDVTLSQSTAQFNTGTGSLLVHFEALPAGTVAMPTERRIFIVRPTVFCGQTVTFRVRMPADAADLTFRGYTHANNFASRVQGTPPATVTPDTWTTYEYTVPADTAVIGTGGIQRIGLWFNYTGATPFTGDVYIDDITWGAAP